MGRTAVGTLGTSKAACVGALARVSWIVLGATFVFLGVNEKILHPGPALALATELG